MVEIEEKLQLIKDNKISIETITNLEKEFKQVASYKRATPTGDIIELSPTDELLALLIKIQIILLKDSLAENMKRDIEFSEQVIGLKEQAESLMKDMGKHFGGNDSNSSSLGK